MRSRHFLVWALAIGAALAIAACGQASSTSGGGGGGDGTDAATSGTDGASSTGDDGGSSPGDDGGSTGKDAGASTDAAFDAKGSNAVCSFNKDCPSAERCECDEATGCFCHIGVRGTGKNGIDPCVTGNDCASALCVEGPTKGVFYCSDECMNAMQCTGMLPKCTNIALVGMICVRM